MIAGRCGVRLDPALPASPRQVGRLLERICAVLSLDPETVDLLLVDDAAMLGFNARHRGLSGPTNVLSFEADPEADSETGSELGELVVSLETCEREAFLYGQPPALHLARLLVHGLLHLTGMDHGEIMEALTEECLDQVEAWLASHGDDEPATSAFA